MTRHIGRDMMDALGATSKMAEQEKVTEIRVDDTFTVNGMCYQVTKVGSHQVTYLVSDGGGMQPVIGMKVSLPYFLSLVNSTTR